MTNIYKEDLEKAIVLLNDTVYFINNVPNKRYKTHIFKDSYELASNIDKFLEQQIEKYDDRSN